MADHQLEPLRRTLHGQFSRSLEPALVVRSGDVVRYRTLDVGWGLEPPVDEVSPRRKFGPLEPPRDDGPCLIGPVAVEGAEPGDVLEVHVEEVVPGGWGYTWAGDIGFSNAELNRALGVADGPPCLLRWALDASAGIGTNQLRHRVRLRPFLGTIGLCPDREGWISAWLPRRTGGNMDCRELVAGSVLYLPVEVQGALVSLGDGHAAQGDGEVGGTAIECPMERVRLRYVIRTDLRLEMPRARTPTGWITFGFSENLEGASEQAIRGMLDLLEAELDLPRKEALALASTVVDLHVTQLVNGVKGVHAVLRHDGILRGT